MGAAGPDPPKNYKNTGLDPLKNHKATPSKHSMLGHHRPASETPFLRADNGLLLVVFGSSLRSLTKKTSEKTQSCQSWTTSDKTFWFSGSAHEASTYHSLTFSRLEYTEKEAKTVMSTERQLIVILFQQMVYTNHWLFLKKVIY